MPMHKYSSLKRWGMTGLAGLMALTLAACGRIPQDGSPSNAAGKNLYVRGFTTDSETCPPDVYSGYTTADLSVGGNTTVLAVVQNDSTEKSPATSPENTIIQITNIHVEYEVPDARMQLPTYDNAKGFIVEPGGGAYCSSIVVFPQRAKDFINQNRSAFPTNPTSNNYFQVRAKVQAQGYETNGGQSVVTPSAFYTINVYD